MRDPQEKVVRLEKTSLKRVLSFRDLFAVGYGDVGSSIYYALGAVAFFALGATPLALMLAGAVFICTSFTYAELSSSFPEPGGSATFTRYAFNDLVSFVAGWALLLDYIMTLAISAFTVPSYLKYFFSSIHITYDADGLQTPITIAIIALLFFVNLVGVRYSAYFNFLLAMFALLSQLAIVLIGGLFFLNLPLVIDHLRIGVIGVSWSPDWWQFLKGTAVAMVAYTGIEAITQLAAEVKNPGIAIPRSIKWTVIVVLFFYLTTSTVALSVVSPEDLGNKYIADPVMGMVLQFPVGGTILAPWVSLIAAIILLIAANAGLIGCSRLAFSMSGYYQIPNTLFKIHPRFRTPHLSLALFCALSAIVVLLSRNKMLFFVDIYNFGAQIAFFAAHLSVIVLRCKKPNLERPYRMPFNLPFGKWGSIPIPAVLGALASLGVWILVVITKPEGRLVGFCWIAIGLSMYLYYRKKKKIGATAQLQVEEIQVPEYERMQIRKILVAARASGSTDALQVACQLAEKHGSKLKAVYVLEIPDAMPMDASLIEGEQRGELALKRAEAVSREFHLSIDLEFIRSRSMEKALLDLAEKEGTDLIVVSANQSEIRDKSVFAMEAQKLLKDAPCRVLFCQS